MYPNYIFELIKNNELKEALNSLFNWIGEHPFDTVSFCDIGYILLNMGDYDEAIRYLNIALKYSQIDKETKYRPTILLNLAFSYKIKGDKENFNNSYLKAKKYIDEYFKLIKNNTNNITYQQAKSLDEELKRKLQLINT